MPDRISKRGRVGSAPGRASQGRSDRQPHEIQSQQAQSPASSNTYYSQLKSSTKTEEMRDSSSPRLLPPGKMLLPPLPRPYKAYSSTSKAEKNRTSHACDKCRKAKAKCSGSQPCDKCRSEGKECVYGDGKRDKERKYVC